jgi:hypothetical protein
LGAQLSIVVRCDTPEVLQPESGIDASPLQFIQKPAEAISFLLERFGLADLVPCSFSSSRNSVISCALSRSMCLGRSTPRKNGDQALFSICEFAVWRAKWSSAGFAIDDCGPWLLRQCLGLVGGAGRFVFSSGPLRPLSSGGRCWSPSPVFAAAVTGGAAQVPAAAPSQCGPANCAPAVARRSSYSVAFLKAPLSTH